MRMLLAALAGLGAWVRARGAAEARRDDPRLHWLAAQQAEATRAAEALRRARPPAPRDFAATLDMPPFWARAGEEGDDDG